VSGSNDTMYLEEAESQKAVVNSSACKATAHRAIKTGIFYRQCLGSSIYVKQAQSIEDSYPPNRISDLMINFVDFERKTAALGWTAPGDDYDNGIVTKYEVRWAHVRVQLSNDLYGAARMIQTNSSSIPSKEARSRQTLLVGLPHDNNQYYFAIRTSDKRGNLSPISNIASVYVPEMSKLPHITTVAPGRNSTEKITGDQKPGSTAKTGSIIGIVLALLLVVIIIVVVWRVLVNRRQKKKPKSRPSSAVEYHEVPKENDKKKITVEKNQNDIDEESPAFN